MLKRDRLNLSEEEEENILQPSKIILRSPKFKDKQQQHSNMEEQMHNILREIKDIRENAARKDELMYEMMREIKELREDLQRKDEIAAQMMQEIKQLRLDSKKHQENWDKERTRIDDKINKLEMLTEKNEKEKRKLNVVIKGLSPTQLQQQSELEKLFHEKMGIEYKIKKTAVIGREVGKQILLGQMNNWEDKVEIMNKKKNLIGTNIYIENDLTTEERRIQTEIRAVGREERGKGKTVKIGYQKLKINSEEYVWSRKDEGMVLAPVAPKSKN